MFYFLNGLGGDETNWTKHGHLDAAADAMKLDAIIVMPDGDDSFYVDSAEPGDYDACRKDGTGLFNAMEPLATTCVHDRKYETYITKDLIAYVDGHYRTIATRDGRAIAGLSMGGYGSLMLAGRHPDLYSAVASHSGVDALFYEGPHPYDAAHAQIGSDVSTWGSGAEPIGAWVRGLFGSDKAFWDAHDPVDAAHQARARQARDLHRLRHGRRFRPRRAGVVPARSAHRAPHRARVLPRTGPACLLVLGGARAGELEVPTRSYDCGKVT